MEDHIIRDKGQSSDEFFDLSIPSVTHLYIYYISKFK